MTGDGSVRVVVDASALAGGSAFRGIGTYLREVLARLPDDDRLQVSAIAPSAGAGGTGPNVTVVRPLLPARLAGREAAWRTRRAVARLGADVLWSPAQSPPDRPGVPWVQTLHDLIPLTHPSQDNTGDQRLWRRLGPRLRDAAAVICPSAASARDGQELLGLPADRTHVVPLGVGPQFRPLPRRDEAPYLLVVSDWGPHKGFGEAFAVAADVAAAGLPHRLLVVGPREPYALRRVGELRAAAPRPDRVQIVGYVEDLPQVYADADALLVSSRAEGFGLPVLEAMACGTPVVGFANSSIPEVAGDAARLVPDGDVAELSRAVADVLSDAGQRERLRTAGLARAAQFTWERTAAATADILVAAARA